MSTERERYYLYLAAQERVKSPKMSYYVYLAKVDGIPRYIGRGEGKRYLHPSSGTSHVYELNKDHFDGRRIEVDFLEKDLGWEESKLKEREYIRLYSETSTLYNKQGLCR